MKSSVKISLLAAVAAVLLTGASASYAQYGACAPACDVPSIPACAPSYEVPTCAPTCDVPTCDVPTCDIPTYGSSYGYDSACYTGCDFARSVSELAAAPFKWIICELTSGIYPDCGCAPRPPKSNCNPCTIAAITSADATKRAPTPQAAIPPCNAPRAIKISPSRRLRVNHRIRARLRAV